MATNIKIHDVDYGAAQPGGWPAVGNAVEVPGPNPLEPAPSGVEVLTKQLKEAQERIATLQQCNESLGSTRTLRLREIAMDTAVRTMPYDTGRGDPPAPGRDAQSVVAAAKLYFAFLDAGGEPT